MLRVAICVALAWCLGAETITGRITEARLGEPLAGVEVRCEGGAASTTDRDGAFRLDTELPCPLRITAVGYRPVKLDASAASAYEIVLVPDSLASPPQSVTVGAGAYVEEESSVALVGNELRNLSSVMADDPLRAIHALPGVVALDDFQGQFSLRSAGFSRIGMVVDGVLLHSPFHSVQSDATSASISSFQGEILESANLLASPVPSQYGDRTAGILELRSRDGLPVPAIRDTRRVTGRINISSSSAAASAEGRLGANGTWLAAARQSYLQYIIDRTADEPGLGFSFRDAQAKLSYDVAPAHRVSLLLMGGHSGLDRDAERLNLGLNTIAATGYDNVAAIASWRYAPGGPWIARARGAWLWEDFGNVNRFQSLLQEDRYTEWVSSGEVSRSWSSRMSSDWGGSVRRLQQRGGRVSLRTAPLTPVTLDSWRGTSTRWAVFGRQAISPARWLHLEAGVRGDGDSLSGAKTASPYASAALNAVERTRFHVQWSQSVQFPEVGQLAALLGRPTLLPARANHVEAGVTTSISTAVRFRVQVYRRADRDLVARPLFEPRLIGTAIQPGFAFAPWVNSQRGTARGVQFFLQRRSANRLNGWVSYSYGRGNTSDGVLRKTFDSDFEARHLAQAVAMYRLRSRWNLTGRFIYGTGMPILGFLEQRPEGAFVSAERNRLRLPDYQRLDLRVNRAFVVGRMQWTLFVEALNLTNHDNYRFDDLGAVNPRTGAIRVRIEKTLPVIPSAGLVVDF